ncbi:MAG: hydrogenase small subunit [Coriobacteriales bacterium]|jgi:hydrogenase small subunit
MATQQVTLGSRLDTALEARGISRRSFLKYCAGVAAMIGLSEAAAPQVAQALDNVIGETEGNLKPVIWMEGASCSGCSESFVQTDAPDVATCVLELLSVNYNELLSAASGYSLEEARKETMAAGNYILVYEGAVVKGWEGNALRVAGEKGTDSLLEAAYNAEAVIALGSCACDGGWQAARPNPANAEGVQKFLGDNGITTPVINIPCCPANPEWFTAVVVEYLLLGQLPELNSKNEPKLMFNETIHDNCPRRGHFENGEFVYQFGSEEEKKGYCLYAVGCKGPQTFTNCPIVKWNRRSSWCVEAGAPCQGCGVVTPNKPTRNWVDENTPFLKRHRYFQIGDWKSSPAGWAGVITGVVVAALAIHACGMKATKRTQGGADFETVRVYDVKHDNKQAEEYGETANKLYGELDAKGLEDRKIKDPKKQQNG